MLRLIRRAALFGALAITSLKKESKASGVISNK
jgi:hypothetical protein